MKIFLTITLVIFSMNANAGSIVSATASEAVKILQSKDKAILTFVGYSGKGYKELGLAMKLATNILSKYDPNKTIVNIGVTPEGIGQVYCIAKKMGFETSGIVSSLAKEYISEDSTSKSCVDTAFIIEDSAWGGKNDLGALTPTSSAMVNSSNIVVRIGGGNVALIEAGAAKQMNKEVSEYEMEMGSKQQNEKFL